MAIPTLISTSTASNSSSIDITSGIDSTYDEYMFVFTDIGPATDNVNFTFQVNAADQSGFNETITSTNFRALQNEAGSETSLAYNTGADQGQGTAYQLLNNQQGSDTTESGAGILHLFSPSNTTYVKHFYCTINMKNNQTMTKNGFTAGYINVTAAIDEISFKMSSGNFDGVIQMYGIA